MDFGHEVSKSVAQYNSKTALVDSQNLTRKIKAAPEGFWWLRSFDLLRSSIDFGHVASESVDQGISKTVLVDARNLTRQI